MQGWREQDAGEPVSSDQSADTPLAAAAVGTAAAGRALTVEERQAKASQDIAAAKARQAAFATQGSSQFTDVDVAQPDTPDFGLRPGSSSSSATDTMVLDDPSTKPGASQQNAGGRGQPFNKSADDSATGTFVLDQKDQEESPEGSPTDTFELGEGSTQSEDENPTGTFILDDGSRQDSSDRTGRGQSDDDRSQAPKRPSAYEPDTSKPLYAQGRSDLKPRATQERDARANTQAELHQKSRQTFGADESVASTADADNADALDAGRSPSTYEPDTSKPQYAIGRADLKPRAANEQKARAQAQAELKAKANQTVEPAVSAEEAVRNFRASGGSIADTSDAGSIDTSDAGSTPSAYEPDTSKPLYAVGRADLKPRAVDEQNARANAQAELKAKANQTVEPAVSAEEAVRNFRASGGFIADTSDAGSTDTSDAGSTPSAYEPDTSKPLYAVGRADLKPRAVDEQNARANAQAELKAKANQIVEPAVSAEEAVRNFRASGGSIADTSDAGSTDTSGAGSTPSAYEPDTSKPLYAMGRADLKPRAVDEQNARANAQAELKRKSQQQQPVTGVSSDLAAAIYKPQAAGEDQKQNTASQQQQMPMSEQGQTADLARGLAGASMSTEPGTAGPKSATRPRLSPFQAQQTASSVSEAAGSPLSTAQQAQNMSGEAAAAQRMAASNQALAAGTVICCLV